MTGPTRLRSAAILIIQENKKSFIHQATCRCMFIQVMRDFKYVRGAGLQGVKPTPHMNVMQNTFTFSMEDLDLLVALVTVHHSVAHRSHRHLPHTQHIRAG